MGYRQRQLIPKLILDNVLSFNPEQPEFGTDKLLLQRAHRQHPAAFVIMQVNGKRTSQVEVEYDRQPQGHIRGPDKDTAESNLGNNFDWMAAKRLISLIFGILYKKALQFGGCWQAPVFVQLRDGVGKIFCQPALCLAPEDIGLIIGFGPHETELLIGDSPIAVINETLFSYSNLIKARHHHQQQDKSAGQRFKDDMIHVDQGRHRLSQ